MSQGRGGRRSPCGGGHNEGTSPGLSEASAGGAAGQRDGNRGAAAPAPCPASCSAAPFPADAGRRMGAAACASLPSPCHPGWPSPALGCARGGVPGAAARRPSASIAGRADSHEPCLIDQGKAGAGETGALHKLLKPHVQSALETFQSGADIAVALPQVRCMPPNRQRRQLWCFAAAFAPGADLPLWAVCPRAQPVQPGQAAVSGSLRCVPGQPSHNLLLSCLMFAVPYMAHLMPPLP